MRSRCSISLLVICFLFVVLPAPLLTHSAWAKDSLVDIGIKYGKKGDLHKAIETCSRAIKLNERDDRAYDCRGYAYYMKRDFDKAIRDFSKAIQINPQNASSYKFRGIVYDTEGHRNEAVRDLSRAIKLNRRDADSYFDRGFVYYRSGEYKAAINDYNRAIALKTDYADVYYNLACAYSILKDEEKACKFLSTAIEKGFSDISYMRRDPDLLNIRQRGCFKRLLRKRVKTRKAKGSHIKGHPVKRKKFA